VQAIPQVLSKTWNSSRHPQVISIASFSTSPVSKFWHVHHCGELHNPWFHCCDPPARGSGWSASALSPAHISKKHKSCVSVSGRTPSYSLDSGLLHCQANPSNMKPLWCTHPSQRLSRRAANPEQKVQFLWNWNSWN
jgi:hypothetical protein